MKSYSLAPVFEGVDAEKAQYIPPVVLQRARRISGEIRRNRRHICGLILAPLLLFILGLSVISAKPYGFDLGLRASSPFSQMTASQAPQKAVVLASYEGQEVDWLHTIPSDWKIVRMLVEGREAYAYLTYIIENYDNLPDHLVFIHGHMRAWHQVEPVSWKLRALNLTALDREGYINLRCSHDSGCTDDTILGHAHPWIEFGPLRDIVGNMMTKFWEVYLKPFGMGEHPADLGQPCCAQFAVTKKAILLRPKNFYINYRTPLEMSVEEARAVFGWNWDKYHSGTLYEYLWHVIFGKNSLLCPDESLCRREYFSDAIACEKYPGRYQNSFGWRSINCTSIYQAEAAKEELSRVVVEEFWSPTATEAP